MSAQGAEIQPVWYGCPRGCGFRVREEWLSKIGDKCPDCGARLVMEKDEEGE